MNDSQLSKLYYDPKSPVFLAAGTSLIREAKKYGIKSADVLDFLNRQRNYTRFRRVLTRYPRYTPTTAIGVGSNIHFDLAFLTPLKNFNRGYHIILVGIDVFSRQCRAEPLKSKKSAEVVVAIDKIIESYRNTTHMASFDRGSEFKADVREYLESRGITVALLEKPIKSALAENLISRIKIELEKEMDYRNTRKWVELLPNIIDRLNSRYHHIMKTSPESVNLENEDIIRERWEKNYEKRRKQNEKPRFAVNDLVRVKVYKDSFQKGSRARFTNDIYRVNKVLDGYSPILYKVEDTSENPETVLGKYYEQELIAAGTENG